MHFWRTSCQVLLNLSSLSWSQIIHSIIIILLLLLSQNHGAVLNDSEPLAQINQKCKPKGIYVNYNESLKQLFTVKLLLYKNHRYIIYEN